MGVGGKGGEGGAAGLEPLRPGQKLAPLRGVVPLAPVDVAQVLAKHVPCGGGGGGGATPEKAAAAARRGTAQERGRGAPLLARMRARGSAGSGERAEFRHGAGTSRH